MSGTLRLNSHDPADMARAAAILRAGETVAFPTETVYGLGANALDPNAVARIFAAKQRPSWDPLIVHIADPAQLPALTDIPLALATRVHALISAFWPGPLTLLLPRSASIPDAVTAARPLIGVRIPAHPVALGLVRLTGLPIAAPSANTFGHISPTTAAHVLADLDGRISAVLDGGPARVGLESTVLDPATMTVYRPGAVTLAQIEAICGQPANLYIEHPTTQPPQSLPSPGVGIRHYAPKAQVILTEGTPQALQSVLSAHPQAARIGVLLPTNWSLDPSAAAIFPWGPWNEPETLAANLFAGLRALDDLALAQILVPLPPSRGLGQAIRDRLQKAAREA